MNVQQDAIRHQLASGMWPEQAKAAEKMATIAMQTYKTHGERAALRCALGDASSLCDAIVRDIEAGHKASRGGGATAEGRKLALQVKYVAEALWLMRERIKTPDTVG